jgi:cation/acetate symporter
MAGMTPDGGGGVFSATSNAAFKSKLNKVYGMYTGGFFVFIVALAILEQVGLPREWIGLIFLLSTIGLYAGIGILSRTSDAAEYYVAGRRVPAVYNGMATGSDWMSAASFIGMAGTLYLTGYGGMAFIMGWTGGYCLVALFTARLTGLAFEIGVFVGLGGILVCSFLGGMRAVTWTQVAQYIILIIAYLIPVTWLSIQQTGVPVPQLIYGQQLEKVTEREAQLIADPKEQEVVAIFKARSEALAAKLQDPAAALAADRAAAQARIDELRAANAPLADLQAAESALRALPADAAAARTRWSAEKAAADARARPLAGMPRHGTPFAGNPDGTPAEQQAFTESRRNFLALVFCLMLGTAALPHILMRYYTTPSVKQARESVTWSLFFICLLYFTAPALAVLVKYEVFNVLVGTPFDQLPGWVSAWTRVDPGLLSVADVNGDGIFQLGEMRIGGDIIVLATPEIAGLPYVISGMVAAGGLAAALSTADGLLLTIANALSHDLYYKMLDPNASTARRVAVSKSLLLVVALAAAYVASLKVADILFLVSAAFSLAAAGFFPALVLGIFWKRASKWGAVLGMISGTVLTFYYMATTQPWLRSVFGVESSIAENTWWGIAPIAAGVFGVPLGFAVIIIVSLLTPAPTRQTQELVEHVRYPDLKPARA